MFLKNSACRFAIAIVLTFCLFSQVFAVSGESSPLNNEAVFWSAPVFPQMFFTDTINHWKRVENSKPFWVSSREEVERANGMAVHQVSILLNNDILAYYGHPGSRNMGILGRHSIEELDKMLSVLAAEYEKESGGRKIQKAFYLIYGTVWPRGEIGIIKHDLLMKYIEYGMKNDILIFIDHQIGRFDPMESFKKMLPFLHYPNVHLALDPEWRTTRPMVEIGHLTAEEIILAQQIMEDYLIEHNLPGERMFVIHQFNHSMIRNRAAIRSDFNRVRLIHCADGFGSPALKRNTYAYNALANNMPIKAFKLFYNLGIPGAGYDEPLMMPKDVYNLNPRPYIIMYQ